MPTSVFGDFTYTVRRLRSAPLFTLTILVTLGVGIRAATAIFSVVDGILLRGRSSRDATNLVSVWESSPQRKFPKFPVTPSNYTDWIAQARSFSGRTAEPKAHRALTALHHHPPRHATVAYSELP